MHVFCYKKNAYKKVNLSTLKVKKVKKKFQTELKKTVFLYKKACSFLHWSSTKVWRMPRLLKREILDWKSLSVWKLIYIMLLFRKYNINDNNTKVFCSIHVVENVRRKLLYSEHVLQECKLYIDIFTKFMFTRKELFG